MGVCPCGRPVSTYLLCSLRIFGKPRLDMKIWASFETDETSPLLLVRRDTRIYLDPATQPSSDDKCVGTIWMCNPGNIRGKSVTKSTQLSEIVADPTLGKVVRLLQFALEYAQDKSLSYSVFRTSGFKRSATHVLAGQYIQVLNLFYAVHSEVKKGWRAQESLGAIIPEPMSKHSKFILFAWGHPSSMGKTRIRTLGGAAVEEAKRSAAQPIHSLDSDCRRRLPSANDFSTDHPRGPLFNMEEVGKAIASTL